MYPPKVQELGCANGQVESGSGADVPAAGIREGGSTHPIKPRSIVMRTPQSHTARENPPSQQHAGRSAHARAGQTRSSMDQLHVPLHLRRLLRTSTSPASSTTSCVGVVFEFDISQTLLTIFARAHGDPDPDGPALHDAARPGEPRHEPRRGIALHPRLGVQRGRGVLDCTSTTASPSDSRCCSWPSSCAPPGPGHAAPHHRRPWQPASTASHSARRSRRDCPPRARPSFARATRGHGHLPQRSLLHSARWTTFPTWGCSGMIVQCRLRRGGRCPAVARDWPPSSEESPSWTVQKRRQISRT